MGCSGRVGITGITPRPSVSRLHVALIDFSLRCWSAPSINTVTSLHLFLSNAVTSPVAMRSGCRQGCRERSAALLLTLGCYVTEHEQSDVTTIYMHHKYCMTVNREQQPFAFLCPLPTCDKLGLFLQSWQFPARDMAKVFSHVYHPYILDTSSMFW